MSRKPVVLVVVEGGVVQSVAAPKSVQVTVRDYDNIKQGDHIPCVWCWQETPVGCFDGDNDNLCPHCHNPTMPETFGLVPLWKEFICVNGGKWKKVSVETAECQENDSAYIVGDVVKFELNEEVFPY